MDPATCGRELAALSRISQALEQELNRRWRLVLVGQSPAVQALNSLMPQIAAAPDPVLLVGEPGAGKHLLARLLHALGPRSRRPFRPLPPSTLQAADAPFPDDVLLASGTLFLRDLAALPLPLQDRLLRWPAIASPETADMRLIAGSVHKVAILARQGQLLPEWLDRLSGATLFLPPLRARREDIPLLLAALLDLAYEDYGRALTFTPQALERCTLYPWPGNLLEMANLVDRLAWSATHPLIEAGDLPAHLLSAGLPGADPHLPPRSRLKELERQEVLAALERHRWVQSQAAAELGLTLRQIGYRVKQFGLTGLVKTRRGQDGSLSSKRRSG